MRAAMRRSTTVTMPAKSETKPKSISAPKANITAP